LYNQCSLIDYLLNKIQKKYKALDKVLEKQFEKQLKGNQEIPTFKPRNSQVKGKVFPLQARCGPEGG